jgi:hypothetical protein
MNLWMYNQCFIQILVMHKFHIADKHKKETIQFEQHLLHISCCWIFIPSSKNFTVYVCMVYSTMLPLASIFIVLTEIMTSEWWIGKDVEEVAVSNMRYYPIIWLEELRKNMINLGQDCRCLDTSRLQIRNTTDWANFLSNLVVEWRQHIVMDLINTLPGNSSVNTVQHATI